MAKTPEQLSCDAHDASREAHDVHENKVSKNTDPKDTDFRAAAKAHQDAADAHDKAAQGHFDKATTAKGHDGTLAWQKGSDHRAMQEQHSHQAKELADRADNL